MGSRTSKKKGAPTSPVGYGRPPVEHRFAKGTSGNPKGRPRKQQMTLEDFLTGDQSFRAAFEDLVTQEVSVRSGNTTMKMPAIMAIARNVVGQALQGNLRAANMCMTLEQDIQRERVEQREARIERALTYKRETEDILAEHAKAKKPAPVIIPHPDDVHVNVETGEITVDGPLTLEAHKTVMQLVDFMGYLSRDIIALQEDLVFEPDNAKRQAELDSEIERFHHFNARLPARLKLRLPGEEAPLWPDLFKAPRKKTG